MTTSWCLGKSCAPLKLVCLNRKAPRNTYNDHDELKDYDCSILFLYSLPIKSNMRSAWALHVCASFRRVHKDEFGVISKNQRNQFGEPLSLMLLCLSSKLCMTNLSVCPLRSRECMTKQTVLPFPHRPRSASGDRGAWLADCAGCSCWENDWEWSLVLICPDT